MTDYQSIRINITIPPELLDRLDRVAKHTFNSRSNAIRLALLVWLDQLDHDYQPTLTDDQPTDSAAKILPTTKSASKPPKRRLSLSERSLAFGDLIDKNMSPEEIVDLLQEYESIN